MKVNKSDRIYVAGHQGLVGSAVVRRLRDAGYQNLVLRSHKQLDLENPLKVGEFFIVEQPDVVVLAAAMVGGIQANNTFPADFIYRNLMIQCNVIQAAQMVGVRSLLFLGSSCIYPKFAPQPIMEESLLTGPLEPTNEAYAIAKIAGIKMCSAYNRQHGTRFVSLMPTNLYGPGDNYDLDKSHVLPALIRKMHEAKHSGSDVVEVWGSGAPRREFLYVDDLADACLFVRERDDAKDIGEIINVGTGEDLTIAELAALIAEVVGFEGKLVFDGGRPDGTPRKLLDVSRLKAAGWQAKTPLREGIALTYADYVRCTARGGESVAAA
jgi:GDP-L-fucose synthase